MPLSVNDAYDIGRKHERDRIIELLEAQLSCSCGTTVSHAIALIKGENNASQ